uniref:Uncharacterized protein n=1 Tax=Triticum urartu TaxID=4572 RepID=A0A8R7TF02_TRIUA
MLLWFLKCNTFWAKNKLCNFSLFSLRRTKFSGQLKYHINVHIRRHILFIPRVSIHDHVISNVAFLPCDVLLFPSHVQRHHWFIFIEPLVALLLS